MPGAKVLTSRRPATYNTTPGAPATTSLVDGQQFFNENDLSLWIGMGTGGIGGTSSQVVPIGGPGNFVTLGSLTAQTVLGPKTFSGTVSFTNTTAVPQAGVAAAGSTSLVAANVAFVMAQPLNTLAIPVAAVNYNGQQINNLGAPSVTADAATKGYVDSKIQGLTPKSTAAYATAAALPSNSYSNGASGVGATLVANQYGALSVDGVAVSAGQLILVKNEPTPANNGLYDVTSAGSGSAAWILTRDVSMNTGAEFPGAFIPVDGGSTQTNTLWMCNPGSTVSVGSTAIPFTQLNGATSLSGSSAITVAANTVTLKLATSNSGLVTTSGLSIDPAWPGQTSITNVGTITAGVWNAGTNSIAVSALPVATVSAVGAVQPSTGLAISGPGLLTVAYGTGAGVAAQGNDSRITGSLQVTNQFSELYTAGAGAVANALANLGLQNTGSITGTIDGGYV